MSDDSSSKSHQASARKIDKLKSDGQVLRSKDLTSGLIFIASIIVLVSFLGYLNSIISNNFVFSMNAMRADALNPNDLVKFACSRVVASSYILYPLYATILTVTIISTILYGGWNFTIKSISFKGEKLNPISNLKRIFGTQLFFNIAKSLFRFVLLMVLFIYCLNKNRNYILNAAYSDYTYIGDAIFHIMKDFIFVAIIGVIVIMIIDSTYSFMEFNKKAMMDAHELKDEYKETEGNPEVKRRFARLKFNIIKTRLLATIPKATVIITNPTHYAVAIKYDEFKDSAPKVIAKGKDLIALQIKEIANKNTIPIYESPSLARSLYYTTKTGSLINPGLYMAVAIVFSYIYQLRQYQSGSAKSKPLYVADLRIPPELEYKE